MFLLNGKSYLDVLSHCLILDTESVGLQTSLILQKDGVAVQHAIILCTFTTNLHCGLDKLDFLVCLPEAPT